jgi:hypothetical protein
MARWIWLHLMDKIDIRLTSPALQAAGLPDHIVLHRGFKDVWDTRLRVAYWWRERLRVGATLRFETSAVDAADVNPGAVDGFKIEPMVMAEIRLSHRVSLTGGYGITLMPSVTAHPSSFDPQIASRCAAAGGSITNADCLAALDGRARPTADGVYRQTTQELSAAVTARF